MLTANRLRTLQIPVPWLALGVLVLEALLVLKFGLYALVLAVLIPALVWMSRRPQRGILVLAALLPFNGLLTITGVPGVLRGWKEGLVLYLLLLTFIGRPEARATQDRRLPPWMAAFLGLLIVGFVSGLTVDLSHAWTGMRISYFDVLIFVVIWRCPLSTNEIDRLVTIFVFDGIITSIVALWQQAVGYVYLHDLGYEYGKAIRFTSGLRMRSFATFNQPFPFAFYLMLTILLALPFALAEPRRWRNRIFFISVPLLATGLVFSYVRGALLGLGIGLLYLAFHRYKLLVAGIPLILAGLLFLPTGTTLTNALFQRGTLDARTTGWNQHFDTLERHPFGSGIGTTGAAGEKAASSGSQNATIASPNGTYQPDNSYVKVGLEIGLPGLWFFVLMLISMFVYTRSVERRTTGIASHFATSANAQLLALIAGSFVATYFEMVPMDQYFWLMAGIVATLAPMVKTSQPRAATPRLTTARSRVPISV